MVIINTQLFRAIVVAQGLEGYAKFKMIPNKAYTPKRMMELATQITGRTFKARDYYEAAAALRAWVENNREELSHGV